MFRGLELAEAFQAPGHGATSTYTESNSGRVQVVGALLHSSVLGYWHSRGGRRGGSLSGGAAIPAPAPARAVVLLAASPDLTPLLPLPSCSSFASLTFDAFFFACPPFCSGSCSLYSTHERGGRGSISIRAREAAPASGFGRGAQRQLRRRQDGGAAPKGGTAE